jgi:hemolysin activation/secretion protein
MEPQLEMNKVPKQPALRVGLGSRSFGFAIILAAVLSGSVVGVSAAPAADPRFTDLTPPPLFSVRAYEIRGGPSLSTNPPLNSKYTGTNLGLAQIVKAASDLQSEYRAHGYTNITVSIAQDRITNGVVTMNAYRGLFEQILVSGKRYANSNDPQPPPAALAASPVPKGGTAAQAGSASTNNVPARKADTGPRFVVRAYEITGDTLLSTKTLMAIFEKRTGTNVAITDITGAASDLQLEYRDRGFPTVNVTIPPQQITNGIVKIRVFQGRLSDVLVTGNHHFGSNNVMRALPSLQMGTILSGPVFQAELDRANANQDRQIYPQIQPGAEPNTTELLLKVKDRLPLHAKMDFNNQSSPGTPDLRLNSSAVYNNLWDWEHSVGLQYSFSPEAMKTGDQWEFYDRPLVANYSGFYRMPIGDPEPIAASVANSPGNFGYDEATRKFRLPAPSGRPELNFYASRSTIDTDVMTVFRGNIFSTNNASLDRQDVQQDLTVNNDIGSRLSVPLAVTANFQSGFSGGLDFKEYNLTSSKTNIFTYTTFILDTISNPGHVTTNINVSRRFSNVPTTHRRLEYLPVALRYDASMRDRFGLSTFGLGMSLNTAYSGSAPNVQSITGSSQSSGHWFVLNPGISRDFFIHTNWVMSLRADGQWASEPLISNEQFGVGGVNSVRGYREGEVFGDDGWRVSLEQKTPPHIVGSLFGNNQLSIRGSVYMDYGEAYLIDPLGRNSRVPLWGVGFGGVAAIGSHWEARLLFSWPLLRTFTTEPGQPRFDFGLTAQF